MTGSGRCGSSLFSETLARHPQVGFVSNIEDNLPWAPLRGRGNGPLYRRMPASFSQKGRPRYAPSEAYQLLDAQVSPIISTPGRPLRAEDADPWLARRFRGFFEQRAAAQGAEVFLHKFTGWPRGRFIAACLPQARHLHVIRDGRAVASSLVQMPWWRDYASVATLRSLPEPYLEEWEASGRSFVLLAGLVWKATIDAHDEDRAGLATERWHDVRYEDALADPAAAFGEMVRFLGLAPNDEFAAGLARHTFDPGRAEAFRRDLDPRTVELLERSLGEHLQRLGYRV